MSKDYTTSRSTAERLIDRFGQVGAIVREEPGSGPEWAPGDATITEHACRLVVVEYTAFERAGTAIEATDKKALISTQGLTVTPRVADSVRIGSRVFKVINVDPLEPGGLTILYEAQIRGGGEVEPVSVFSEEFSEEFG